MTVTAKPHWHPNAHTIGKPARIDRKYAASIGKQVVPCIDCGIDCMVPQSSAQTWERCGACMPRKEKQ
jgi:hypothetical protein